MDDMGKFLRRLFGLPSRNDRARSRSNIQGPDSDRDTDGWRENRSDDHQQASSFGYDDDADPKDKWSDGGTHTDLDKIFDHFHGNIWQNMESLHHQMEEMMKNFGAMDFPSDVEPPQNREGTVPNESLPSNPHDDNGIRIWFGTPSPFFRFGSGSDKASPRDFMLKEGEGDQMKPALPAPANPGLDPPIQPFISTPQWRWGRREERRDSDLDGKLSDQEMVDMITKKPEAVVPAERSPSQAIAPYEWSPGMSSWGKSVSITRVRRPDGKLEERRVVRDSAGREESSITKSAGDQSHTVTTVTEHDGRTETRETFHNMNEKDVNKFEAQWDGHPRHLHPAGAIKPPDVDAQDRDLFSKLFGRK